MDSGTEVEGGLICPQGDLKKSLIGKATAILAWVACSTALHAASLADFGYRNRTINGRLPIGGRPLLVIMACFDPQGPSSCFANFEHQWPFYHDLVFNFARSPVNMNAYFLENSNGRFWWTGVDTELGAGAGLTRVWINSAGCLECPGVTNVGYYSNIVRQAMQNVRFADYDANRNGVVTQDEMAIAIINSDFKAGGTRDAGYVPGPEAAFHGQVSNLGYYVTFDTWCHELSHSLRTLDLYGTNCSSYGVTLLSCSGLDVNDRSWHLDPWHKMQFGWSEPRIRSLTAGGVESISAAQLMDPAAPIILNDHGRGTSEFFMLEYRTPTSPNGPGYDANVASDAITTNGLAIWHIKQDGSHNPVFAGGNPVVWTDGSPNLLHGGSGLWGSDVTTPELRYLDGTSSRTRIRVLPFSAGGAEVRVEWLYPGETWVDFSYVGVERGSFAQPFNTLVEGVFYGSHGGTIRVKAGSRPETLSVSKRLVIQSFNGPVTIGR